ncbi:MAG: desulfoferrodoxin [Actinobacteria bacterium]|nr:desulfoferrodoxin [Actinomycetota bacterium]
MTEKLQIYKCEVCGNIVEMLHGGKGDLVCCNEPMKLYKENTVDAAVEKHVPVVNSTESGMDVMVGSVKHPMEESHFIEWIEVIKDGRSCRQFLKPGQDPAASFCIKDSGSVIVREYCNLHGLWKR